MTSHSWSTESSRKRHYVSRDLSEVVSNLLQSWHVPGISLAVVDGDNFLTEVSVSLSVSLMHEKDDASQDTNEQ